MIKNFYLVTAKCGHVGKGKYYEVDFPVYANDRCEAAQYVLKRSKVKKHLKNAISNVCDISQDEYLQYLEDEKYIKFISAHTKKELLEYRNDAKTLVNSKSEYKKSFNTRAERVLYTLKKQKLMEAFYNA